MSDDQTVRTSPVFNKDDADFRLRSSDNVYFSVHRIFLCAASDVFKAMITVPQPSLPQEDDIPCVDLAENGVTIELLLHFIYPMKSPSYMNFNQYVEVLEAASKYAVEGTIDALRVLLLAPRIDTERKSLQVRSSLAESDPLRAYAVATSMGWSAEAIHCSTLTLRQNLSSILPTPELDNMPTRYYRHLTELHEERKAFFRRLFEDFEDDPGDYRVKKCKECGEDPLRSWWEDYIARASTSVNSRPLGDRVFDLSVVFPPDDNSDDLRCSACPSVAIPIQTLYALSRLQNKLNKKRDSVRPKFAPPAAN